MSGRGDAAQPGPSRPVLCEQHEPQRWLDHVRTTAHRSAAPPLGRRGRDALHGQVDTEERPDPLLRTGLGEPDGTGHRVPVGQRERRHAPLGRPSDQVLRMGGTVASGVTGRDVQMGEARHATPPSLHPFSAIRPIRSSYARSITLTSSTPVNDQIRTHQRFFAEVRGRLEQTARRPVATAITRRATRATGGRRARPGRRARARRATVLACGRAGTHNTKSRPSREGRDCGTTRTKVSRSGSRSPTAPR